jgi:murein DD-endopeptidase MepM/ murein hydrolase activator NlpD
MRRVILILVFLLLAGGAACLGYGFANDKLEDILPGLEMAEPLRSLGRATRFQTTITDPDSGLREVKVSVAQNHRQITVFSKEWDPGAETVRSFDVDIVINAQELGLVQGPATVLVEARDRSWRRWMRGNHLGQEFPVQVVLAPPRITVLSRNIYINRGGAGLVIYRVNESVANSWVQAGNFSYPSFSPWPHDANLRLCYFAFEDSLPQNTPVFLNGDDGAGSQVRQNLSVQVRWRDFSRDNINLSDSFLKMAAAEAAGKTAEPFASDLEAFKWLNETLRAKSAEIIDQAVARSDSRQLWRGAFLRPVGQVMSNFIEHRTYLYQGAAVGSSTHYGLDLADVANTPIRAGADGRVVFAADAGIYGNCIVIDHGLNLFTLYAHLSVLEAEAGDSVTTGQRIGLSGSTGFSFGDHLHFSCMIGNTFVTPYEWWDPKWIADNVELRFQEAGVAPPQ